MTEQAGEAVPVAQRSSWTSFLKSIASFSGDLSSMTAPPFILSPVSLTEFPAYWCERPELFSAIADAPSNEDRALAVLRWFISTLKGQYTSRNDTMGSEKKPLNPVLGELFYGSWPNYNNRGRTDLLVEQVSHHPPITAYVIENKAKGLKLVGHNAQKTSFSGGSIIVKQIGHAILTYTPPPTHQIPEPKSIHYLLTFPRLRIDGLWYGSPYIELSETTQIVGGGYIANVEYKGKGYFSGKPHSFKAVLTPDPTAFSEELDVKERIIGKQEYVVEGTWHQTSKFIQGASSPSKNVTGAQFHSVLMLKEEVIAHGGEAGGEMGPYETRKLWGAVAKGIREGDFETASREKSRIENEQRALRKEEAAADRVWGLKHFAHVELDDIYERLAGPAKVTPPAEDIYDFLENWPAGFQAEEGINAEGSV